MNIKRIAGLFGIVSFLTVGNGGVAGPAAAGGAGAGAAGATGGGKAAVSATQSGANANVNATANPNANTTGNQNVNTSANTAANQNGNASANQNASTTAGQNANITAGQNTNTTGNPPVNSAGIPVITNNAQPAAGAVGNQSLTSGGVGANQAQGVAASSNPTGMPTIISTLHGAGGKTYFLGQDGNLYFRAADGTFHVFGTFMPVATGTLTTSGTLTADQLSNLTPEQREEWRREHRHFRDNDADDRRRDADDHRRSGTNDNDLDDLHAPRGTNNSATVFGPAGTGTNNVVLTPRQREELAEQLRLQRTTNASGIQVPATTGPLNGTTTSGNAAVNPGFGVGGIVSTVPNTGTNQVSITGTVLGVDGKTLYVGANGFLYYRGQDGALHIVGSGQR